MSATEQSLGSLPGLTDRKLEVLRLLAAGHAAKTIATRLGRLETSINERLRAARRKTGIGSSRVLARLLEAQKNPGQEYRSFSAKLHRQQRGATRNSRVQKRERNDCHACHITRGRPWTDRRCRPCHAADCGPASRPCRRIPDTAAGRTLVAGRFAHSARRAATKPDRDVSRLARWKMDLAGLNRRAGRLQHACGINGCA